MIKKLFNRTKAKQDSVLNSKSTLKLLAKEQISVMDNGKFLNYLDVKKAVADLVSYDIDFYAKFRSEKTGYETSALTTLVKGINKAGEEVGFLVNCFAMEEDIILNYFKMLNMELPKGYSAIETVELLKKITKYRFRSSRFGPHCESAHIIKNVDENGKVVFILKQSDKEEKIFDSMDWLLSECSTLADLEDDYTIQ